jgi:hypothetical protein
MGGYGSDERAVLLAEQWAFPRIAAGCEDVWIEDEWAIPSSEMRNSVPAESRVGEVGGCIAENGGGAGVRLRKALGQA